MPIANASVVVNRRPEEVFAYLADVSRHGEWSPKPYRVEALTEGPVRVSSRFRSVGWLPRQPETVNEVEGELVVGDGLRQFVEDLPGVLRVLGAGLGGEVVEPVVVVVVALPGGVVRVPAELVVEVGPGRLGLFDVRIGIGRQCHGGGGPPLWAGGRPRQ